MFDWLVRFYDKKRKKPGTYRHTRDRVSERYGLHLPYKTFKEWLKYIKEDSDKVMFSHGRNHKAKAYIVPLGDRKVFVVYVDDIIVTALPWKDAWVKQAEQYRERRIKKGRNKNA